MRRAGPQVLTVAVQLAHLLRAGFEGRTARNQLDVVGDLQPTVTSDVYTVRIRYKLGRAPRVAVSNPTLQPLADGTPVPHVYQDLTLCLYYPKLGEWGPHLLLIKTIVPWAMEWLYYYEAWHATGEWLGGGEHPRGRGRKR